MQGKGSPVLAERITALDKTFTAASLSMGNPHCVIFLKELSSFPVEKYGPVIENLPIFPERTNVEFAKVLRKGEVQMRVWERGVGETLACGTGAAAVAVAGALTGRTDRKILIHLLGGDLKVDFRADDCVYLTGAAETVFQGQWPKSRGAN
jgi:diaminopimelate epimerase